jgi:hypothetical protein
MVPFRPVFGSRAFDDARADAGPAWWQGTGEDGAADFADEVDGGAGDDSGGIDDPGWPGRKVLALMAEGRSKVAIAASPGAVESTWRASSPS